MLNLVYFNEPLTETRISTLVVAARACFPSSFLLRSPRSHLNDRYVPHAPPRPWLLSDEAMRHCLRIDGAAMVVRYLWSYR